MDPEPLMYRLKKKVPQLCRHFLKTNIGMWSVGHLLDTMPGNNAIITEGGQTVGQLTTGLGCQSSATRLGGRVGVSPG